MDNKMKFIKTRNEYVNYVKTQLMGPGSEDDCPDRDHEVLSTGAAGKYCLGIIYPQEVNYCDEDENDGDETEFELPITDNIEFENSDLGNKKASEDSRKVEEAIIPDDVKETSDVVNLAMQRKPSSFGMTFYTKENPDKLSINISFAVYKKNEIPDCKIKIDNEPIDNVNLENSPFCIDETKKYIIFRGNVDRENINSLIKEFDERELKKRTDIGKLRNKFYILKEQLRVGEHRLPYSDKLIFTLDKSKNKEFLELKFPELPQISVTVVKRFFNIDSKRFNSFTVMLVNNSIEKKKGSVIVLQPELKISTLDENNHFSFVDYSQTVSTQQLDEEEQALNLLYRNKKNYATGLGTATNWEIDSDGNGYISTDFYPMKELPDMSFERDGENDFAIDRKTLLMYFLSDLDKTSKESKIEALKNVCEKYEQWINSIETETDSLETEYIQAANKNILACKDSLRRMKEGVEILSKNDEIGNNIWLAFSLANRAMYMQREQLGLQKNDSFKDYRWRPFQLAFLLLSIKSIIEDNPDDIEADRNIVDLIWFPTGGGKTEAYLGLTALTIFYRRLAHPSESGGTTVIMRYTMRLLTTQQFLRAATLICACEKIRQEDGDELELGEDEITIGLWVGSEHTPNKLSEANYKIKRLIKANTDFELEYNFKFQVRKCPWCGSPLIKVYNKDTENLEGSTGYKSNDATSMHVYCTNEDCYFAEDNFGPLPIKMVDEDLYENPPTLLFGTVDKFAMLAWKNESGIFFGVNTNNRGPELIIQDELHLISSSLGTIVGLYEAAIDKLCSLGKSRPKIIASTATIRRAVEQCRALYNRPVKQFPAPGIDSSDSYFSKEGKIDHEKLKYGRLYVGMMSPKVKDMLETKAIGNLLHTSKALIMNDENGQEDEELRDAFWTLVVYFNTTKELGKCRSLVNDNVISTIKTLSYINSCDQRYIGHVYELTGQTKTGELVKSLDVIEKVSYSDLKNGKSPANIVLATNMISVGIDIPRLNVMLIVGQPKLTSEYIQASSRVGRNNPGVAFVIYDSSKSRDRSHYEQFKPYHESFYKFVEPTGVTPFSKPARKRALSSIVIILLRNMLPDLLGKEQQAGMLLDDENNIRPEIELTIQEIKKFIVDREKSISKMSNMESDESEIVNEIDDFISKWKLRIIAHKKEHENEPFCYGYSTITGQGGIPDSVLLKAAGVYSNTAAQETLTSMRNVDPTVSTDVLIFGE